VTRAVIIKSEIMGIEPPELGAKMVGSYLRKLCRADPKPTTLVFYGTGVKLLTEGSPVLDALEILHRGGVDLVICSTCLGFYQLKDKVQLGRPTDMVEIISILTKSDHVVTL
jgi:intracellular sulfur oxidation DsrE/DsrF family protein